MLVVDAGLGHLPFIEKAVGTPRGWQYIILIPELL